MMVFAVPQFQVSFTAPDKHNPERFMQWIVNGDQELEALCKILRWNGITGYTVAPYDPSKEQRGL